MAQQDDDHEHSAGEYRRGRRDAGCRAAHNEETSRYRQAATDKVPTRTRKKAAALLREGLTPVAVASKIGITWQLLHELARVDEAVHRAMNGLGDDEPVELTERPQRPARRSLPFDEDRQKKGCR